MSFLSCPACVQRTVSSLSLDHSLRSSSVWRNGHRQIRNHKTAITKRSHATYESLTRGHHKRVLRAALAKKDPPNPNTRRKGAGSLTRGEIKDALAREHNRKYLLNSKNDKSLTDEEKKLQVRLKRDVEQYYPDPLQLANAVVAKLRVPDFDNALALVRASEGIVANNVVSWNHCIDWCMLQGDTERAWKLYNELKKRGNRPDSHTYTIMLRGYSQNARRSGNAERAVSIYNSMFAPNSAVVPNTIHTNAVLNVCARNMDLDSMWAIAGRLPEKGPGSPDRVTFTTILHGIREDAVQKVTELFKNPRKASEDKDEDLSLDERQRVIFENALKDGRKLWADVSFRWRRADLVIDERLVCTMGMLILGCGESKDMTEIFDLVDSTMNIKLAERGHKKGAAATDHQEDLPADECSPTEDALAVIEADQTPSMPLSDQQVYASPSRSTLSLILKAALAIKDMKLGKAYWHYLTTPNGPYKIAPDAENIIAYLRLLRVSRASRDSVDILSRDWPADVAEKLYRRGTFVIAMSTCCRDKNNPRAFDTADRLLTLMEERLEEAEVGMYTNTGGDSDTKLTYKERKAAAKARLNEVDDTTFGEDEARSELQRSKSGVESMSVDPKALAMYLELAIAQTEGWNEGVQGKEDADRKFERNPKKNVILRALNRTGPDMINLSRLAKMKLHEAELARLPQPRTLDLSRWGKKPFNDRAGTRVAERMEDLIDLMRTFISAYDRVISLHERFEDQGRKPLDGDTVQRLYDNRRKISGFLTKTKHQVQDMVRGDLKYVKWRNQPDDNASEIDEDLDEERDEKNTHRSRSSRPEIPGIARDVRQIYHDTDANLGRLESRSRKQKLERKHGVIRRLQRRMGVGEDVGVLNEKLEVERKAEVEERMRRRAFNIRVQGEEDGASTTATAAAAADDVDAAPAAVVNAGASAAS